MEPLQRQRSRFYAWREMVQPGLTKVFLQLGKIPIMCALHFVTMPAHYMLFNPFSWCKNQSSKQIAPSDNMQPKVA